MVIYNLFTSVVELNSFVLGSAVQSSVIHFSQHSLTHSLKTTLDMFGAVEHHVITPSNHIEPPVSITPSLLLPSVLNTYVL